MFLHAETKKWTTLCICVDIVERKSDKSIVSAMFNKEKFRNFVIGNCTKILRNGHFSRKAIDDYFSSLIDLIV